MNDKEWKEIIKDLWDDVLDEEQKTLIIEKTKKDRNLKKIVYEIIGDPNAK